MANLHQILTQLNYDELSAAHKNLCHDPSSMSQGELIKLEDLDKLLLQNIRGEFYKYNTMFEQILKFKPVRKINL